VSKDSWNCLVSGARQESWAFGQRNEGVERLRAFAVGRVFARLGTGVKRGPLVRLHRLAAVVVWRRW